MTPDRNETAGSDVDPLVSVIVPAHDAGPLLAEGVRSVLAQGHAALEVVVVDDGSRDGSADGITALGANVRLVRQEQQGPAAARNRGIELARGELVAFLDADDLWPADSLALRLERLRRDPALDLVLGRAVTEGLSAEVSVLPALGRPHVIPLFGCGLFRKSAFRRIGPLNASLRMSEDHDWFLRAKEAGLGMAVIPAVTLVRRAHADSLTAGASWKDVGITRVLKSSLDRRRAGAGAALDLPRLSDSLEAGPMMSVVVPVYNGARFLGQALDSALAQDHHPFEVIVVDDGSSDDSAAVAQSREGVRYLHQANAGVATARNRGIALSRGEFIALLDQDDIWPRDKLRVHAEYLASHPEADCSVALGRFFLEPGCVKPRWLRPELLERDLVDHSPSSIVYRRSAFERIGPFDSTLRVGSDVEWVSRAKDKGLHFGVVQRMLAHRRIHGDNHSREVESSNRELLTILRESIQRKARGTG